jgi:hypothetical protein
MDALVSLCTRGILLDRGTITFEGTAIDARARYLENVSELEYSIASNAIRGGSGGATIMDVWLEDANGERITTLRRDEAVSMCLKARVSDQFLGRNDLEVAFGVNTIDGHRLFTVVSSWTNDTLEVASPELSVACDLASIPLVPGKYLVDATIIFHGDTLDCLQHCASFHILPAAAGFHTGRLAEQGVLDVSARFRRLSG